LSPETTTSTAPSTATSRSVQDRSGRTTPPEARGDHIRVKDDPRGQPTALAASIASSTMPTSSPASATRCFVDADGALHTVRLTVPST
jgi:hypothetical protein